MLPTLLKTVSPMPAIYQPLPGQMCSVATNVLGPEMKLNHPKDTERKDQIVELLRM
ncbi:hypothetical protein CHS0354_025740, partial [Potamilus streckersoni]